MHEVVWEGGDDHDPETGGCLVALFMVGMAEGGIKRRSEIINGRLEYDGSWISTQVDRIWVDDFSIQYLIGWIWIGFQDP